MWNQFSFLKHNVKYFREGRSREAFWGLIILVFLRAIFCCIHVRTHPCLEARETSLSLRATTVHGASLCSIHSSLFWSFSNCIVSFTGFSARIQKYLKLSVSLAFHLLPFPKLKKYIRQTHSLFFCVYIEQWNYHLPKCSPLCFHRCFQVLSRCCSFGLFLLDPVFARFIHLPLCFSSGVTPAGKCSWNPTTKIALLPVRSHNTVLSLSQQLSWRLSLL